MIDGFKYISKPIDEYQDFSALVDEDDAMGMDREGFIETVIDQSGAHLAEDFTYKILYANPVDKIVSISIHGKPVDMITHPKDLDADNERLSWIDEFSVEVETTLENLMRLEGDGMIEVLTKRLSADGFKNPTNITYHICGTTAKHIRLRIIGFFETSE